ncbi:MOSC domain-containing protein [Rhodococcus zopfii]|uniref:MOSC domain-containing protein n=1 Tax=Rhodococcus zopfii TaxID=43772 RepID=UPI000932B3FE|nr:MOSC N-terminal beta barrel domain-containing protein [Rhodococcus zopfii]
MLIRELWRYPVKSFGGEPVRSATIEADGLRGDHLWAVVDAETGAVAGAKKSRRFGVLLTCRARLIDDTDVRDRAALELTLPDGTAVRGDDSSVDSLLSDLTGREVRLEARRRTYDEAHLHLLSTSAVETLETGDPVDVALRRFRPQIVLDAPGSHGFVEDSWLGRSVALGTATIAPTTRTARCVMVTLAHQEVPARREMLRTVTARNLVPNLPGAKPAPCVGIYASVRACGDVTVGDTVTVR